MKLKCTLVIYDKIEIKEMIVNEAFVRVKVSGQRNDIAIEHDIIIAEKTSGGI